MTIQDIHSSTRCRKPASTFASNNRTPLPWPTVPDILLYETESPATMVRAERQIRQLFGMKANEVAGYRFSMNSRSGHWSFTGPAGMVPGQQATVKDEGKARSVADGIFEQMNARASKMNGLPRLFQTDVLKFAHAMPHISPSSRELVAWDVNYRVELRPSRDEKAVTVEDLGIHLRISTQGVLQQLHYNLLPIKAEQKTDRIQVANGLQQQNSSEQVPEPAIVYRPAPGRVVPYYYYAHRPDGGNLALYYPACAESPEVPRTSTNDSAKSDTPDIRQEREPNSIAEGNIQFTLFFEPFESFSFQDVSHEQSLKDAFIQDIYNTWNNNLVYHGERGSIPIEVTITPSGPSDRLRKSDPQHILVHIGVDDGSIRVTHTAFDKPGCKEAWFRVSDLTTTNVPAHEFGHMLGLEDRYAKFQQYITQGSYQIQGIDGDQIHVEPDNRVEPPRTSFETLPLLLPFHYDRDYNFRGNLMSSQESNSSTLTNFQLRIAINHYNGRSETESLPVSNNFSFISYDSWSKFNEKYPNAGVGLFIKTIESNRLLFQMAGRSQRQTGTGVRARIVYGDIPSLNEADEMSGPKRWPFNMEPINDYSDMGNSSVNNLFYIVPRSWHFISGHSAPIGDISWPLPENNQKRRELKLYLQDPYNEMD